MQVSRLVRRSAVVERKNKGIGNLPGQVVAEYKDGHAVGVLFDGGS